MTEAIEQARAAAGDSRGADAGAAQSPRSQRPDLPAMRGAAGHPRRTDITKQWQGVRCR
jgi:hypothetical protein